MGTNADAIGIFIFYTNNVKRVKKLKQRPSGENVPPMASVEASVPSICSAENVCIITCEGQYFMIKKSAVIGISICDQYLHIHIKHFEGNSIKIPVNAENRDKLFRDAGNAVFL
jgi:hypothetical protein